MSRGNPNVERAMRPVLPLASPQESLLEHFEHINATNLKAASRHTTSAYRTQLRLFNDFLERPALLADLTDANVAGAMDWLLRQGKAIRTAEKFRANLISLWRMLLRRGVVRHWPTITPLHAAGPEPLRAQPSVSFADAAQ